MAPKSHSAKPASASKAKSTSSATKIKQDLLKSRKPVAVSLHAKKNHNLMLKGRKPAENDALRKTLAMKEHVTVTTMIPRPDKGVAGSGFNLQEAMGLADDPGTYALLRRSVRDLAAKAGIDCAVLWYRQPKDLISKIIGLARQRHTYFKRFPHGWAIEEFLKSNLKNKRAYARKRGYLGDMTNRGVESDDEGSGDDDKTASNSDNGSDIAGRVRREGDDNGASDSLDDHDDDDQGGNNNSDNDDDQGRNDTSDMASDYTNGYEDHDIYVGEDNMELEYTDNEFEAGEEFEDE